MTHVLIAADLFTTGFIFIVVVVVLMLVGASRGEVVPWRRRNRRRGFWYTDQQNHSMFGQDGLLDDVYEMGKETFSDTNTDLSIYKSHDNSDYAPHTGSSGSILGLNGGTPTGTLDNSNGGFGSLGEAAAEYLAPDYNSSGGYTDLGDSSSGSNDLSDWSSGGSFGDSGGYSSDSGFSDNSSSSDTSSSFSDDSSGGTFSNDD